MRLGLVGSEQAKFTPGSERTARWLIRELLAGRTTVTSTPATHVVSGGCHLGGVDIFAVEEAQGLGLSFTEHLPTSRHWDRGYKPRNIKIARDAEYVVCITVDVLPLAYTGRLRFPTCYHCPPGERNHVKSGGCWTVKYARLIGKGGITLIVKQEEQ
jgi:hypothetical protein